MTKFTIYEVRLETLRKGATKEQIQAQQAIEEKLLVRKFSSRTLYGCVGRCD